MKASKGSSFEREVAKALSLWWSGGKRSDIFWRVGGSGGRAKGRGRKGLGTKGQHGDITATDPSGEPFIDLFTIELKRGFNSKSIQDVLDRKDGGNKTNSQEKFEVWFQQVYESYLQAGSLTWMMIVKRDHRNALVFLPFYLFTRLRSPNKKTKVSVAFEVPLKIVEGTGKNRTVRYETPLIKGLLLEDFLHVVLPEAIKELSKKS